MRPGGVSKSWLGGVAQATTHRIATKSNEIEKSRDFIPWLYPFLKWLQTGSQTLYRSASQYLLTCPLFELSLSYMLNEFTGGDFLRVLKGNPLNLIWVIPAKGSGLSLITQPQPFRIAAFLKRFLPLARRIPTFFSVRIAQELIFTKGLFCISPSMDRVRKSAPAQI